MAKSYNEMSSIELVKEMASEYQDRAIAAHILYAAHHSLTLEGHQQSFSDCPSYSCIKARMLLEATRKHINVAVLGSIKSKKKAASSAENGRKGGRPKKVQE